MDDIPTYAQRVLVDHARGRNLNQASLNKWVADSWGSILSPLSEVTKLVKGWIMVLLPSKNWEMVGVPIILQRWAPIFYASRIKISKEPIWVRLPGLPFELWTSAFFHLLGDHMGEFIDLDYSFKHTKDMAMARTLVLLDLREGLAEDVCLATKYGQITQTLDYEGVPFGCHRFHSVDHLMAQCDRPFSRKWRHGSRKYLHMEEEEPIKKAKGVSVTPAPILSSLV